MTRTVPRADCPRPLLFALCLSSHRSSVWLCLENTTECCVRAHMAGDGHKPSLLQEPHDSQGKHNNPLLVFCMGFCVFFVVVCGVFVCLFCRVLSLLLLLLSRFQCRPRRPPAGDLGRGQGSSPPPPHVLFTKAAARPLPAAAGGGSPHSGPPPPTPSCRPARPGVIPATRQERGSAPAPAQQGPRRPGPPPGSRRSPRPRAVCAEAA